VTSRWSIPRFSTQLLLLLLWAALWGLSYPWPNLWLLAHLALVPLTLVGLFSVRPGRMMLAVLLAGWAWWVIMLRWMIPVTDMGTIAVSLYKALYPFVYVNLLRLTYRHTRVPLTISVPILWTSLEYLRGQVLLSGFPWFYLGHSQPVVMIQVADLIGAPGVTFIVAMTSGLICDLLTKPLVKVSGWKGVSPVRLCLPLWAVVMIGTLGYGVFRLAETVDGPTIRIAVVQSNIPQSNKDSGRPGDDEAMFAQMLDLSESAMKDTSGGGGRPDLIIWPETMVPRAINDESIELFVNRVRRPDLARYRFELERFAREHKVAMVVGAHAMLNWREGRDGFHADYRYNSAYLIDPTGRVSDRYDKVHRVPFGEYIPWVDNFPELKKWMLSLTPYDHDYTLTPGNHFNRFSQEIRGRTWRFGVPICFEDVMSYVPRTMVYGELHVEKLADVLLNITNDGWFAGTSQSAQHEQIGRFRCVENRVAEARAVNTGVSGVLDSCGRLALRLWVDGKTTDVAGVATASVAYDPRVTLFGRIGDLFAVACTVVMVLLVGWSVSVKLAKQKAAAERD
jgi:apolipoprotein N-acyltransferase